MKKKLLVLLMAGVLASFAFVGCSDDEDTSEKETKTEETADAEDEADDEGEGEDEGSDVASAVIGSWMTGSYINGDESYNPEEYAEANGIEDYTQLVFVYTFNEDGTVSAQAAATGEVANGEYTIDGDKITATFENGSEVPFEYSADQDMLAVQDPNSGVITLFARYNGQ